MKLARLLCSIFLLSGCVSAFVSSSLDDRQISDPKSVMSALNAAARPVPIEDPDRCHSPHVGMV